MAMQDSWRDRIEQGKDLLSLGHSKTISFSGDGGGEQATWNPSASITDNSNGTASSALVSTCNGATEEKATPENSEQSGSVLKEHDYIGMAEVSSATSEKTQGSSENAEELNLKDTDLCLGLGLGLTPSKKAESAENAEKIISFTFSQQDGLAKTMVDANVSTRYACKEGAPAEQRSLQTAWNASMKTDNMNAPQVLHPQQVRDFQNSQISMPVQDLGSMPRVANAYQGTHVLVPPSSLKNGVKRGYKEAMSDAVRFNTTSEVRTVAAMSVKNVEGDLKALPKQPQGAYLPSWAPAKPTNPTPWHVGLEQAAAHPFGPNFGPSKALPGARTEKPAATVYKGTHDLPENVQESATNDAPPSKDRVVGWPPIRSYRKNTLAKPMEMFVKVNMDGVTVGRKVDLNAHNSYDCLLSALEEMFQPSNNAQGTPQAANSNDSKQFRLLHGSDFVLTYEDKDGDWMLVGDVPWSMFTNTVRRLRITRGSEASGPSVRGSEKIK